MLLLLCNKFKPPIDGLKLSACITSWLLHGFCGSGIPPRLASVSRSLTRLLLWCWPGLSSHLKAWKSLLLCLHGCWQDSVFVGS